MRLALGDSGLPPFATPARLKGLLGVEVGSWGQRTASSMSPNMAENVVPYTQKAQVMLLSCCCSVPACAAEETRLLYIYCPWVLGTGASN